MKAHIKINKPAAAAFVVAAALYQSSVPMYPNGFTGKIMKRSGKSEQKQNRRSKYEQNVKY